MLKVINTNQVGQYMYMDCYLTDKVSFAARMLPTHSPKSRTRASLLRIRRRRPYDGCAWTVGYLVVCAW